MKLKKLAALLLAAAMVVSMMVSCTSERTPQTTGDSSTASTESTASADDSGSGDDSGSAEGVTVGEGLPDTLENPDISIVYWYGKNAYKQAQAANPNEYDPIWEAVAPYEEKYGGTVNIIETDWNSMAQKVVELQNAGQAPDLMEIYDAVFHTLAISGSLLPLTDYVSEADYVFYDAELQDLMSWEGVPYAIPIKPYWPFILFNRDMLDIEGQPMPDELFKNGEWTFEKFAEIVNAVTKVQDGAVVQFGFGSWNVDGLSRFLISNDTSFMNVDQATGTVTSGFTDQKLIDTLDWMRTWAANPTSSWIQGNDAMFDAFEGGSLAMIDGVGYPAEGTYSFNWGYVPYPTGPDSPYKAAIATMPQGFAVPAGSKNPEAAVAFMRISNQMQVTVGDDRLALTLGQDVFDMLYNNPDAKLVWAYDKSTTNINQIVVTAINMMVDDTPAATIAETIDPQLQADIDAIFG